MTESIVRIYLDTETTGLDPATHEILEVAVVRELCHAPYNEPGDITHRWCRKIAPKHIETAEPVALKVNGYTAEGWAGAVPFESVALELLELLKGGTIIGHNCLAGSSMVLLADGSTLPLQHMVSTKHPGPVLTFNETTHCLEPKKVVGWVKAPPRLWDDWVRIRVQGKGVLNLTRDHQVLTTFGRKSAEDIQVGDRIVRSLPSFSQREEAMLWGSLAGDGSLVKPTTNSRAPIFEVSHGSSQASYLGLKGDVLTGLRAEIKPCKKSSRGFSGPNTKMFRAITRSDPRLNPIHCVTHPNGKKTLTSEWLKHMSDPALAIWYCDDGQTPGAHRKASFCVSSLGGGGAADLIVEWMQSKGWPAKKYDRPDGHVYVTLDGPGRWGNENGIDSFWNAIAPYVPVSMAYKLPKYLQNRASDSFWTAPEITSPAWSDIVVEVGPMFKDKKVSRYDGAIKPATGKGLTQYCLTVEGNSNFFASGLCVSNCKFDTGFITAALLAAGVEPKFSHRTIDTTTVAYMAWGLDGKLKLSLDNLRKHLGLSSEGAHTALQDALDCRVVFYRALSAARTPA